MRIILFNFIKLKLSSFFKELGKKKKNVCLVTWSLCREMNCKQAGKNVACFFFFTLSSYKVNFCFKKKSFSYICLVFTVLKFLQKLIFLKAKKMEWMCEIKLKKSIICTKNHFEDEEERIIFIFKCTKSKNYIFFFFHARMFEMMMKKIMMSFPLYYY